MTHFLLILTFSVFNLNFPIAQVTVENGIATYLIDFDNTQQSVNNGSFDGSGFNPTPEAGQLDGDAWEVVGMSDGSHLFGGTSEANDFARGSSTGGVTTGGLYAFDVGGGNMALGVQPVGSDFTPGDFTLKITNNRTVEINALIVSYTVWVYNDQPRSNSFNFSHSPDHSSYTAESSLDFTSPATADGSPGWASHQRSIQLNGLSIAGSGGNFYLRWTGDDVSGADSRDEFALDDISVTVLPICPTGDITLATQADMDNFAATYIECTATDFGIDIGGPGSDISSLSGLSVLTHVGGNLRIFQTSALQDLAGLGNLTTVGGNLDVFSNSNSSFSFAGLSGLTSVGGQFLASGNSNTNFNGLSGLTSVGHLTLEQNSSLTDLTALSGLTSLSGNLTIDQNVQLASLDGLSGLTSVGGNLYLRTNPALTDLTDLGNIASIGSDVEIDDNDGLTALAGLAGLTSVGGQVDIKNNALLANLDGLTSLTSLPGYLKIHSNPSLTSLIGLSNLNSITGELSFFENNNLTSLTGLEDIGSIGSLNMTDNALLSTCAILGICNHLNSSGPATISGNAAGCATLPEVQGLCDPVCPTGTITLASQADVDAFPGNFPNCTTIGFNVIISGPDINNLGPLAQIETITGGLTIINNPSLTTLTGLDNLTSIAVDLNIRDNDALVNLDGLGKLEAINSLLLVNNNALTNVSALSMLTTVNGSVRLETNAALASLDGLENLSSLNFGLRIINCDALTNLTGLSSLATVNNDLWVSHNDGLTSLTGLSNLTSIAGELQLFANSNLASLAGLGNIGSIGDALIIANNSKLTNIMALSGIDNVPSFLFLSNNPLLESLSGLNNITSIGALQIEDSHVTSLSGLSGLQSVSGGFSFENNNFIADLSGLNNLTSIGGDLRVGSNENLTDLVGLQNVLSIGGSIDFYYLPNLNSLQALSNVTAIGGYIKLENLFDLTTLNGLENIDHTTITDLDIYGCSQLSTCEMLNICQYLDDGGTSEIHSNAAGCNSQAEVDAACPNPEIDVMGGTGLVSIMDGDNTPDMGNGTAFDDTPLPSTTTHVFSIKNVGDLPLTVASITVNSDVANVFELGTVSQTLPYNLPVNQTMTFEVDFTPNGVGTFMGDVEIVSNDLDENPFNFDLEGDGTDNAPSGNVIFLTQAQVDAFVASYPGETAVVGFLQIGPITGTSDISDLSGLDDLQSVGAYLLIQNNPSLGNLTGLDGLQTVTTDLTLENNANLGNLNGLGMLQAVTSNLTLKDNTVLNSVSGLSGLTTLGGNLLLENNDALQGLAGLGSLASISGDLTLKDNNALNNLTVLATLTTLGGDLTIDNNDALTSLVGLGNIASLSANVTIQNNNQLSACNVDSVCELIENSGTPTISNNAPGCNSAAEIEANCTAPCPTGQEVLVSGTGCIIDNPHPNDPDYPVDGYYSIAGMVNGKDYYQHSGGVWHIVWVPTFNPPAWIIAAISGNQGEFQYYNPSDTPKPPVDGWINLGNFCAGHPLPDLCGDVNELSTWTGPSGGNWNSSGNWSNNAVPTAITIVTIPNNADVIISSAAEAYSVEISFGGALAVNGQLTLSSGETVNLTNASSSLSGTGTINGNLFNANGQVQPGSSPGKLTINGDFAASSGTLDMEINGTTAQTEYDVLDVTGTATISSGSKLHLTFGYNPAMNDFFDLINASTVSGSFNASNVTFSGGDVTAVSLSYPGGNKVRVTVASLLPVELLEFSATPTDGSVLLQWRTASETNNQGFEIQRSADGRTWQILAFIPGHGTSLETNSYSHTDRQPLPGVSYYRLRQMDFDGKISHSPVVSVDMREAGAQVNIFPNPFSKTLQIQLPAHTEGTYQAHLLDVTGKSCWRGTLGGGLQVVELPGLQAGVYWLELENEGRRMRSKIVKM